mmetsp:Transcript_38594/g.101809  ORF Transcript_38594/g.101809 Transcript_38594/m.101809 type:complete len:291 (+) Transcript_38594:1-873(+)
MRMSTHTDGVLVSQACPADVKLIHHGDKMVHVGTSCKNLEGIVSDLSTAECTGTYEQGKGAYDPYKTSDGCFAKDSATACRLSSPVALKAAHAMCFAGAEPTHARPVLMAELSAGDEVLTVSADGTLAATTVVANQHKAADVNAENMLTFHMADGSSVSMTPSHGVFADGALAAASNVQVGATLTNAKNERLKVRRITVGKGTVINPVTVSGTILANGLLAASNPVRIASRTINAPRTRAVVNALIFLAGDVDTIAAGIGSVLAKAVATAIMVAIAARVRKMLKRSNATC